MRHLPRNRKTARDERANRDAIRAVAALLACALLPGIATADTATLPAQQDTTLYQTTLIEVDAGNGAGDYTFTGVTKEGLARRAVLRFDVAGAIPAGATIDSAQLRLFVSRVPNPSNPATVAIHRLSADWGEGDSDAAGEEGQGQSPPSAGDATWRHRYYDTLFWSAPGGDFAAAPSASATVGDEGAYAWGSTAGLVADVQFWLEHPAQNFGWIVVADETDDKNAKRFDSSENLLGTPPELTLQYTPAAPVGACCSEETCQVVSAAACGDLGGTFSGVGTSCSPSPCFEATGACCANDGSCSEITETTCSGTGGLFQGAGTSCAALMCPVRLTPWLDALPLPKTATPVTGAAGAAARYAIAVRETTQQLHTELPPTVVWGYDDGTGTTYPGPTIEARSGQPVSVNWLNDLRDQGSGQPRTDHVLEVDTACIHGAADLPKTVTHLHGGHVAAEDDGYPEDAYLPGQQLQYDYPNGQQAGTLWYHDHALGITRLNVYMGLAGLYTVRDDTEDALDLPAGAFEVPLVLQDRRFEPGGALYYPDTWQDHFFGDTPVINGKAWPYLEVTAGKYRFRLVNGSGSRVYTLALASPHGALDFTVIGTEGGLLPVPVTGLAELTLGPGERYDVVVDFAGLAPGAEVLLSNSAPAPYPNGAPSLPELLKFIVVAGPAFDEPLPGTLRPVVPIDPEEAVIERDFVLRKQADDGCGRSNWLINGLGWNDITEYPVLGTVETWRFINDSGVSHPMHMHLVFFQVLDRQDYQRVNGEIVPIGEPRPPDPWEAGWKDTVMVHPGELVRVIARFEDYAGKYAYHCHILEHEDHEMMRQFQTIVPGCEVSGDDESFCDGIDNDCDGLVDEGCRIFEDGFETLF